IHTSGGLGTDTYRADSGRCRLEAKSEAHAQIKPNIEVRRYRQQGGSDAYSETAITRSERACGRAACLADRPAIRASLITFPGKNSKPKMNKHPPMPARDRGGMFTLNNPDDGTPIKELFKLNEELLLIITEKFTYGLQVADQIDPDRTNPDLAPNF